MVSLIRPDIHLDFDPYGGRIIALRVFGQELLWPGDPLYDPGRFEPTSSGVVPEPEWRAFKRRCGFCLSGGDRTWIAPENKWWEKIPPLELDAGRYAERATGDTVVMTSPACRETGLRLVRTVRLADDGDVYLRDEIVNVTDGPITRGIWNVTRVQRPFTVYFSGSIGQWRSYHLQDPTLPVPSVQLIDHQGQVGVPCVLKECYKFGGMPVEGFSRLVKKTDIGDIAWDRDFKVYSGQPYAHDSAVEVFNSHLADYGEVELHSPLYTLGPGERAAFDQRWRFSRLKAS